MSDKIQTGISITEKAHAIIRAYADEYGMTFSTALEVIVRKWAASIPPEQAENWDVQEAQEFIAVL